MSDPPEPGTNAGDVGDIDDQGINGILNRIGKLKEAFDRLLRRGRRLRPSTASTLVDPTGSGPGAAAMEMGEVDQ